MTPPLDQQAWLDTFRDLLRHYLPQVESTPLTNVGGICAVLVGCFLAFRTAKYERGIVATFAMFVGAWAGYRISLFVGTPEPISAAIGAVALTAIAYRTYRWWLAAGSVVVLFFLAIGFQLGRGDLQRYLPTADDAQRAVKDGRVALVTEAEQIRNLHPSPSDQIGRIKDRLVVELQSLGPMGWLIPLVAAVIGGLLAWWALRVFAVIWLGFLGAVVAVLGASAFVCAHWQGAHQALISNPQVAAQSAIGLWLLGLILQAKESRFPKRKPAEPAREPAKA
jgi:cytochrome bd-type quinol oxidase subunit 2